MLSTNLSETGGESIQIILEAANLDVAVLEGTPDQPEGAVLIVAAEGQIRIPLSLPRLVAIALARRILELAAAGGHGDGRAGRVELPEGLLPAPADHGAGEEADKPEAGPTS